MKDFQIVKKEKWFYSRWEFTTLDSCIEDIKRLAFNEYNALPVRYYIQDKFWNTSDVIPNFKTYKNEEWKFKVEVCEDWYDVYQELEFDDMEELMEEFMEDLDIDSLKKEYNEYLIEENVIKAFHTELNIHHSDEYEFEDLEVVTKEKIFNEMYKELNSEYEFKNNEKIIIDDTTDYNELIQFFISLIKQNDRD